MPETPYGLGLETLYQITNQRLAVDQSFNPDKAFNGLMPWLNRPAGFSDFTPSNIVNIGAVGIETDICIFNVPTGQDGVITAFVVNYSASDFDTGDLVFRVYVDDRPVKNFDNILTNLGNQANPWPVRVRVFSNNRVRLAVFHQANVTLTGKSVMGAFLGYTYSRSMAG